MPAIDWDAAADAAGAVDINQTISDAAQKHGVDPGLIHAVVKTESGYNPNAKSPAGAQGLMQLMPGTARDLGVADPYDPKQNIDGGVRLLKRLQDKYHGDTRKALAAYNAGEKAVDDAGGVPAYPETQNYVNNILGPEKSGSVDWDAAASKFGAQDAPAHSGDVDWDAAAKQFGAEDAIQPATIPGYGTVPGVPRPKVPGLEPTPATPAANTKLPPQPTGVNPELTTGTGFTPADFAEQQKSIDAAHDAFMQRWALPNFQKKQTNPNAPATPGEVASALGAEGASGVGLSPEQLNTFAKGVAQAHTDQQNFLTSVGDAAVGLASPENVATVLTAEFGGVALKAAANTPKVVAVLDSMPGGATIKKGLDIATRAAVPAVFGTQAASQSVAAAKAGQPTDAAINAIFAAASLLGVHEAVSDTAGAYPTPAEKASTPSGQAAATAKAYAAAGENLKASEWVKAVKVDVGDFNGAPAYVNFTGVKNGEPHFDLVDKTSGEVHASGTHQEIQDILKGPQAEPTAGVAPAPAAQVGAGPAATPPTATPEPPVTPPVPSGAEIKPNASFETPGGKFTVKTADSGVVTFEKETPGGQIVKGKLPEKIFRAMVARATAPAAPAEPPVAGPVPQAVAPAAAATQEGGAEPEAAIPQGTPPPVATPEDSLYQNALKIVTEQGKASTSALQRNLRISYGAAQDVLDRMHSEGIIGPADGSKPRELLKQVHSPEEPSSAAAENSPQPIEEPLENRPESLAPSTEVLGKVTNKEDGTEAVIAKTPQGYSVALRDTDADKAVSARIFPTLEQAVEHANTVNPPETGKFSSTQMNLPEEHADAVRDFAKTIPENELAEKGREDEPHVTVKYGLHSTDSTGVRAALTGETPATVHFGKLSVFRTPDADVLKVGVSSPDLHRMNAKIAEGNEHTDTYPQYSPHVTVAYLKPGDGAKYDGKPLPGLTGKSVTMNSVTFSPHEGERSDIPLAHAAETPRIEASNEPIPAAGENSPALGGVPANDVQGTPGQGETDLQHPERGQVDAGRGGGASGEGLEPGPGEGNHPSDVGVPAAGERTAAIARVPTGSDYRITPSDKIGEGTIKQKANDNLEAIRTLKRIEDEERPATPDEQKILVKYVGWGGMPQAFMDKYSVPREWAGVREELDGLLNPQEFASARASTPNAHYTSPLVIEGTWNALQRIGASPTNGNRIDVLEPSMGVGHFFGLQPGDTSRTARTGIELDQVTGRIAKLLYPETDVHVAGFEAVRLPDNYFDIAVSNVPFGNYGVHDPQFKRSPALTKSIHDYFFAKALEKVRPGGVVAFVTSNFTLDKRDPYIRKYLASKSDLVGAIRLPNAAFKGNAGTEVTTDIIFLKKRALGEAAAGESWADTMAIDTPDGPVEVNEYYARHPEMMIGQMGLQGSMYRGGTPALTGELTPEKLAEAVSRLPENIIQPWTAPARSFDTISSLPSAGDIKEGAYAVKDGQIVVRQGDHLRPTDVSPEQVRRIKGIIGIRDATREVFNTQRREAPEADIVAARKQLNKTYDVFTKVNGPLHSRQNVKAFAEDPDAPLILSLENWEPESKKATKTAIFKERTIQQYKPAESANNATDALSISMNERGRLDWVRMQELTGRTPEELQTELGNMVFRNPEGRQWEPADEYLSGNVREKLASAQAAARTDPAYQKNVDALTAVQPKELTPEEIAGSAETGYGARLGSSWIPKEDVRDFVSELLEMPKSTVHVGHMEALGSWSLTLSRKDTVANSKTYGTNRIWGNELIEDALNLRNPTIYDTVGSGADRKQVVNEKETLAAREVQQIIKDKFSQWVWQDPDRAKRLTETYNTEFNSLRLREYDGSHLTFPGMSAGLTLRAHQKNAIWRQLQAGNTLLAHVVGAGKTLEIVGGAMEMRRLGLARKPMIVVPKNRVEGTSEEFLRAYPAANILVMESEDFTPATRQKMMGRIATGNWDSVIVSYESFEKLPVSDETFNGYLQDQIDDLEEYIRQAKGDKGDARLVKELEKSKKRLESKLRNKADREGKDRGVAFEDLGVDQLFVDEFDNFKNLFFPTKMTRIAGIPNTESKRAFDMFIKTQHIMKANHGRGLVTATGTPIANSMAEMWTMQRYHQPQYLRDHGLQHFDAWAQTFGEVRPEAEVTPDGTGMRVVNRFSRFVNIPELVRGFRLIADVQTAKMLNLPTPRIKGGSAEVVSAEASPFQKAYLQKLAKRAADIRNRIVKDPRIDNMLKVTTDGRKAALDMRLVDPSAPDWPGSKVNKAIDKAYQVWKDTAEKKSTQLIFLDFSKPTDPGSKKFSVSDDVKAKLIKKGIPPSEVAFIHEGDTKASQLLLFQKVNDGRVRILIGSTQKMGVGVNVQRLQYWQHHLDAPWRPRDIEQREGRGVRQGNTNAEIGLSRYVTEPSFDARMWDILRAKAFFIGQVLTGDIGVRSMADAAEASLSYGEVSAIASGNPAIREKTVVDSEVRKLDSLRARHQQQQGALQRDLQTLPSVIMTAKNMVDRADADIATRDAAEPEFTIGKDRFTGDDARKKAGEALHAVFEEHRGDRSMAPGTEGYAPLPVGTYRGFRLEATTNLLQLPKEGSGGEAPLPDIKIVGRLTYSATTNQYGEPSGTIQSIEARVRNIEGIRDAQQTDLDRAEKKFKDTQELAGKPFEQEDKLKGLLARQAELAKQLQENAQDQQALSAPDDQEATPTEGDIPDALLENDRPEDQDEQQVPVRGRGEAGAVNLSDLVDFYDKHFGDEGGLVNYSGLGSHWTRGIRNLSQIEKANKPIHTAAIRAASDRAQASTILRAAIPLIQDALKDGQVSWKELRLAMIESRLQGIRQRWIDFANQAAAMSDEELQKDFNEQFGTLLDAIKGKKDIPQEVSQTAAALHEVEDWQTLRDFLHETFMDASRGVATVMEPEWYDSVVADPSAKKALAIYKRLVEKPMGDNHALNEGVFSTALGPLDTYYPLIATERDQKYGPGRRLPYRKPNNPNNKFATGMSEDYDTDMAAFKDRLAGAVRANNKAALVQVIQNQGWLQPLKKGAPMLESFEGPDGREYVPETVETAPARVIVTQGKAVHVPAQMSVMPQFMARELRPILDRQYPLAATTTDKIIKALNSLALTGPTDAVFHSVNLMGTLIANTPFLGNSPGWKAASLPILKKFTAMVKIMATDPTDQEAAKDMVEMAKLGLIPDRFASIEYGFTHLQRERAAEAGSETTRTGFAPFLFGRKGLDIRARLIMYRVAKEINPGATPQELYHFVNQLGNYVPALQSEVERAMKRSGLSPFYTAGSTMLRNGVNAIAGTGPMPKPGFETRAWQQFTGGLVVVLALWALVNQAVNGKYPWEDKDSKLLQIKAPNQFRHSDLGNALWGKGSNPGYVNFGFFNPLALRGARLLGLPGMYETHQLRGSAGQMTEAAQRDFLNAFLQPGLGPVPRGLFVGLTGNEAYLTGLRDREGKLSPQFFPAIPPRTPAPALGRRAAAAAGELNAFYKSVGIASGMLPEGRDLKANQWVKMITDLAAPGLVAPPSNQRAKADFLQSQRAGMRK